MDVVNLRLDELSPVDPFCMETIMPFEENPKMAFIVTVGNCEGPLMVDLESCSGAAPRPVPSRILALVGCALENALAHLGRNVTGFCFSLFAGVFFGGPNLARARFFGGCALLAVPL